MPTRGHETPGEIVPLAHRSWPILVLFLLAALLICHTAVLKAIEFNFRIERDPKNLSEL